MCPFPLCNMNVLLYVTGTVAIVHELLVSFLLCMYRFAGVCVYVCV